MNLDDLRAEFRQQADDAASPPLFADTSVDRWLNEAVRQACIRARLIQDATTPAVCRVAITTAARQYALHPAVFDVISITREGAPKYRKKLELRDPNDLLTWDRSPGKPQFYGVYGERAEAGTGRMLVLDRTPDMDDVLNLHVYRLPLDELMTPLDEPPIAEHHHLHLVDYALYRAFRTPDSDAERSRESKDAYDRFEDYFGVLPSAYVQQRRMRHKPVITRPAAFR